MSDIEVQDSELLTITKKLYSGIEKYEKMNRLHEEDIPQFKQNQIRPLHPHKIIKGQDGKPMAQKYKCKEIMCDLKLGQFFCWKATPSDDDHTDLGVAMCLYFKFLKHIAILFLFISILSIFSILLFYKVADTNEVEITKSYKQFLFSSSIGVMSLQEIKCEYHIQQTAPITSANFTLSCPTGFVVRSGPTYTSNVYESISNCNEQLKKLSQGTNTVTFDQRPDCVSDSTSCQVEIENITINNNFKRMSYVYKCQDARYQVGDLRLSKIGILSIIVGIDLLCCIFLILFLWSERTAQKQQISDFNSFQVTLRDYSIEVQSFNEDRIFTQSSQFIQSIENRSNQQKPPIHLSKQIVQVKLPEGQLEREYFTKSRYSDKIFTLIRKEFFEKDINPEIYKSSNQFIEEHFKTEKAYNKYKRRIVEYLEKYIKTKESKSVQKKKLSEEQNQQDEKEEKESIIVTFENTEYVDLLLSYRTKKWCSKPLQLPANNQESQEPQVDEFHLKRPPVPDLILWKNRGMSKKQRLLRRSISWILTVILICGSILLIGYVISRQRQILEQYNFNVDCSVIYPDQTFTTFDQSRFTSQQFYEHCFCSNNAVLSTITTPQFQDQCSQWSEQYSLYLSIPLLFSFGIVCFNVTISYVFLFFSYFQAHTLLNNQMTSYIIKRSIVLILNTGVILTVLNFDYNWQGDFLEVYEGVYDDFTGDWYFNIGIIITLTIIFNMLFPLLELMLYAFVHCLRVCWDKKCFTRKTSLKYKYQYLSVYGGFVYPIQERYSTIIAVLFISLLFNAAVPLINPILVLFFTSLLITDRFLVFKLFRKLPNYENTLHKNMVKIIYVFLVLHVLLTAFLITSPYIRQEGTGSDFFNVANGRFGKVFSTEYSIPYVILFFLLVGWGLIFVFQKQIIVRFYRKCCKKMPGMGGNTDNDQRQNGLKQQNEQQNQQQPVIQLQDESSFLVKRRIKSTNFYDTLNKPQVKQLINVSEYQIERENKLLERVNLVSNRRLSMMSGKSQTHQNVLMPASIELKHTQSHIQQPSIMEVENAKKYETFLKIEEKRNHKLQRKLQTGNLHSRMPRRSSTIIVQSSGERLIESNDTNLKDQNHDQIQGRVSFDKNRAGMIGPASYEKEHHEKMLQEEIQVIFLDNLTTQIQNRFFNNRKQKGQKGEDKKKKEAQDVQGSGMNRSEGQNTENELIEGKKDNQI